MGKRGKVKRGAEGQGLRVSPEKSRIINSIFLAILDIEGFPFFLENVWAS